MSRHRPSDGFQRLLEAGLATFARKGLGATRMADVAREMGVATGTVYQYVDSKEALFYALLDHGLREEPVALPAELPLTAPPPDRLMARLAEQVVEHFQLPRFGAALASAAPVDAADELQAICEELWDFTARTRRWVDVIERSSTDMPQLRELFAPLRQAYFQQMAEYVRARIRSGAFRDDIEPMIAGRVVIETITFFARHRHNDPHPVPMPEAAIRPTVIRLVGGSLLKNTKP